MKRISMAFIIAALASNAIAQTQSPRPDDDKKDPYRERLGLRAGYVTTPSGLDDMFGAGLNLAVHYIHRFKSPFAVDVTFGTFHLGDVKDRVRAEEILGARFDDVTLRIITMTINPMLELKMSEKSYGFFSAGIGLYTVSLLLDANIREFEGTNSHFGINIGAGAIHQFSTNWFADLNVQAHRLWTSTGGDVFLNGDDIFFHFSNGDKNPWFYNVTVGLMVRVF